MMGYFFSCSKKTFARIKTANYVVWGRWLVCGLTTWEALSDVTHNGERRFRRPVGTVSKRTPR